MKAIERIFQYFNYKEVKHTVVEKKLGMSGGYLMKMYKQKASIGSDSIEKLLSFFPDLNPNWVITGTGGMLLNSADFDSVKSVDNEDIIIYLKGRIANKRKDISDMYEELCLLTEILNKHIV